MSIVADTDTFSGNINIKGTKTKPDDDIEGNLKKLTQIKSVRKISDFDEKEMTAMEMENNSNYVKNRSKYGLGYVCEFIFIVLMWLKDISKRMTKSIVERRHRRMADPSNHGRLDGEDGRALLSLDNLGQSLSRNSSVLELKEVQVTTESMDQLKTSPRILTMANMKGLLTSEALPVHLHWKKWTRLYSSTRDGDSFHTMLYKVKGHKYSVIAVKTMKGEVFGGFVATEWQDKSESYFGTGQSFLFSFVRTSEDAAHIYKWTGSNMYIQLCDSMHSRIALGGGGSFGLVIENNFSSGSSGVCDTFANSQLASTEMFNVLSFEIYGFVDVWS